ncbi:hypothetical protein OGZ01_21915 [Vibrio harveyi]|nr:hypothetical protein [Vibrio harveyi]
MSIDGAVRSTQAIFLSTKAHPNKQNQSQDTILRVTTMKAIKSIIIALLFTSTLSGCVFNARSLSLGTQRSSYFDECQYQRSTTG